MHNIKPAEYPDLVMSPEQEETRYKEVLSALSSRWASGRLCGLGIMGDPVRVYCGPKGIALFVASDVLEGLGYRNLEAGAAQHLRRCPVAIHKVRLAGKRGYPYASALDSDGVSWLIAKTRPRCWEDEFDSYDQRENIEAFTKSWDSCLSLLPHRKPPVKYPDLEAMRYTEHDRKLADELLDLQRRITARKIASGERHLMKLTGDYFTSVLCAEIKAKAGPWNLQP